MIRNDLLAAVSLIALAAAGAANAADLASPAAEEVSANMSSVPMSNWAGFYLGAGLSSENGTDTLYKEDSKLLSSMPLSGVGGFLEGGYDFQAGDFVFGVNANYDLINSSAEYQKSAKTIVTESLGNGWAAGVRAGLLANESTLVFGSVGYTARSLTLDYNDLDNDANDDSFSTTLNGYYVGAGIETALTETLSLKAEYRYSQFDGFTATDITKSSKDYVSDGSDTHQVRVSLDWNF